MGSNDLDGEDDIERFMKYNGVTHPTLLDYDGFIPQFYKATGYGMVVVIDAKTRRITYLGGKDWTAIRAQLVKLGVMEAPKT
jgi:hypothetical protein